MEPMTMPAIAPPDKVLVPLPLSAVTVTVVVACRANRDALVAAEEVGVELASSLLPNWTNGQDKSLCVFTGAIVAVVELGKVNLGMSRHVFSPLCLRQYLRAGEEGAHLPVHCCVIDLRLLHGMPVCSRKCQVG
jgi:hypothetical protein